LLFYILSSCDNIKPEFSSQPCSLIFVCKVNSSVVAKCIWDLSVDPITVKIFVRSNSNLRFGCQIVASLQTVNLKWSPGSGVDI
jgi:hypothetical protein